MSDVSDEEVEAAFQVGGKMIERAFAPGGSPVLVREVFRAALTAAAQVRAQLTMVQISWSEDRGKTWSSPITRELGATEPDSGPDVLGIGKGG